MFLFMTIILNNLCIEYPHLYKTMQIIIKRSVQVTIVCIFTFLLDFINISHRPLGNPHWDRPDGRIVLNCIFF